MSLPFSCPFMSSSAEKPHTTSNVPSPKDEFSRITQAYPALASTGCTANFCQSGRMIHTDEDRVGRNQPLDVVEQEAVDFLLQLRRGGIIQTEQALNKRTKEVIDEIRDNSKRAMYNASSGNGSDTACLPSLGVVGGTWTQTVEELEFGVRLAWKHARKCIMRSEYKDLKLCDLRHITSSANMATELISKLKVAFNGGEIRPTAFAFPPRGPNERGPMILNSQLLSFAGYTEDDGSILGDPSNAEFTKAIIELGWAPPSIRSKWDLLPLVTMAQGEKPVITELPGDAFPLVPIQHPRYTLAFNKLGLRWVPAPALSRLGFTIGGVQYTAAPFIGWFMDAEIGVRNLVDPLRYNALPQAIKQMRLYDGDLDTLPDFERLALLSRAQLEINYAVSFSFAKAGVRMIDSLGASELFSRFDDEHLAEHGYRLPSDSYWLSPPQGSIIPLWHHGGSPNYQPKPMICHHVQDPIKAWRREEGWRNNTISQTTRHDQRPSAESSPSGLTRRVFVVYCSSGTVANKLCNKLQRVLCSAARADPTIGHVMPVQTLNAMKNAELRPNDWLVVIASNTRKGEMPQNGKEFTVALEKNEVSVTCPFAIFGNGSKEYPDTFNRTAKYLTGLLQRGSASLAFDPVLADAAAENPPWRKFNLEFCERLLGHLSTGDQSPKKLGMQPPDHQLIPTQTLLDPKTWFKADVEKVVHAGSERSMRRVVLNTDGRSHPTMSYIYILPPNAESSVQALLRNLNVRSDERLHFAGGMTAGDFFRFYADLEQPFKGNSWISENALLWAIHVEEFKKLPVSEAVARMPSTWRYWVSLEDLCRAVPRIQARKYSIANDDAHTTTTSGKDGRLELLVQHHVGGRFSDHCLQRTQVSPSLACKIEPASQLERMAGAINRPLIIFTTGSGIAPVRCLLQHRAELMRHMPRESHELLSLFAGFKAEDEPLIHEALVEGLQLELFEILKLTPSNPGKRRAQDTVFEGDIGQTLAGKIKSSALVFSCAKPEAEEDFLGNLSALLGRDARDALGDRYIADIFVPAV